MDYRTVRAKIKRASPRQLKAAKLLSDHNLPIRQAMREAGYSQATADRGISSVPAVVMALMPQESNLVELGRNLTPELQENLVRGRLALNTLRGKDAGVNSAKALGTDKRVNMFVADVQTGIIVVVPPSAKVEDKSKLIDSDE